MSRPMPPRRYTFNPNGSFAVRRPFKMQGRQYDIGEPFSRRNTAISPRSLRQLYEAGKIEHASDATGAATGASVPPSAMDIAGQGAAATGDTSGAAGGYTRVSEDMSMDALRAVADAEGADRATSKKAIIDNIIANRKAKAEASDEE